MRRRANTGSTYPNTTPQPNSKVLPIAEYSHVSTYRSTQIELQVYSPSLKVHDDGRGPVAVFSGHDRVGGKVSLDSGSYHTGRLTVSLEGAFSYRLPRMYDDPPSTLASEELQKHIFLSSSTFISITNSEATPSRSVFKDTFARRRPPSDSNISITSSTSERSHPFSFILPQGLRPEEEIPATFLSTKDSSLPDYFDVTYRIIADWEPSDSSEIPSHLEVPFLVHADSDFQCVDASAIADKSWLEMPLKPDRPIPVRCAITLPTSVTFSRSSSIPYFVVFTTTPRSSEMAKEIAADATISVSLMRQITINAPPSLPPSPPLTPTSDDSDSSMLPHTRLLRRVARSHSRFPRPRRTSEGSISLARDKPLPQLPPTPSTPLPTKSRTDMRTIYHDMCIGFPKRPRQQMDESKNHPSLETMASLPDGLHKSRISLNGDMLPCVDWGLLNVKYYIDISVLLGTDDFRARIPIRIF